VNHSTTTFGQKIRKTLFLQILGMGDGQYFLSAQQSTIVMFATPALN
jgi:hypothetical protein